MTPYLTWTYKAARRLVVFIIGSTVVVFGIILIFTPGPASLVIPIGLTILATEFVWAKRLLNKVKEHATNLSQSAKNVIGSLSRKP